MVFPQATRQVRFDPGAFNTLATKLAARAGVPVVPIALKTDFVGVGRLIKEFGRVDRQKPIHIRFGPPLPVTGTGRETQAQVVDFISASLREWGGEVANGS